VLPSSPTEDIIDQRRTTLTNNIVTIRIGSEFGAINDHIQQAIPPNRRSTRVKKHFRKINKHKFVYLKD
jgi:hypothetical protein